MKDYFKRAYGNKVGPGGIKCPCCGPVKRNKKQWRRYARKKAREEICQITNLQKT